MAGGVPPYIPPSGKVTKYELDAKMVGGDDRIWMIRHKSGG